MTGTPEASASGTRHRTRHRARRAAVQMLYQWEVGQTGIDEVLPPFGRRTCQVEKGRAKPESIRRRAGALHGRQSSSRIDALITETAEHWRLSRMAALDRLILRLAIAEFLHGETPRNVVINEALELAKTFSGDESAKFVNGILDAVKKKMGD